MSTREDAIWRAYCRGVRGCQILPVNGDTVEAEAAMALGAVHGRLGEGFPMMRPEVLIIVSQLCGEEQPDADPVGEALIREDERKKVLDALEAWWKTSEYARPGADEVLDWIAEQRKGVRP